MYQKGTATHVGLIKMGSNFSAYGQPFFRLFHHFFLPVNAGPSPCIEFLGWDLDSSPILRYDQFSLIPQYPLFIKTWNTHNTFTNPFLSLPTIFQVDTCDHFISLPLRLSLPLFIENFSSHNPVKNQFLSPPPILLVRNLLVVFLSVPCSIGYTKYPYIVTLVAVLAIYSDKGSPEGSPSTPW